MGLEQLKKEVNKKYKQELMVRGSKIKRYARFPTGSLALDLELGGGIPLGKIITIVGEYSDGKTSLVLKMVGEYQKTYPSKDILWMDAEGCFDHDWTRTLGVDPEKIWVVQPEYQQQAFDIINKAIEYDVGLIVVDSIAALVPKEEAEASFEDWNIGLAARVNSKAMRGFQSTLNTKAAEDEIPPTIILINQLRETISSSPYKTQTEPGGKAIGFHSAIKIYLKKGDLYPKPPSNYDVSVVPKAQQIKFYIEKNKTAPPRKRGWTWFYFDTLDALRKKGSIDHIEELVRYCRDYEVVKEVSKGRFEFLDPTTGELEKIHGINNFAAKIRQYPELVPILREELLKRVQERYDTGEEQTLDDSNESTPNKEAGDTSSEENEGLPSDSFWGNPVGQAGLENGHSPDPAQASWEKVSQDRPRRVEEVEV